MSVIPNQNPQAEPDQATSPVCETVFLTRQPIFGPDKQVIGYQLLFRSIDDAQPDASDSDRISAEVLNSVLHGIGMQSVSADRPIFIHFNRNLLIEKMYELMPPELLVVGFSAQTKIDNDVIEACKQLKEAGYRLALDGVSRMEQVTPLLPYVHIAQVDSQTMAGDQSAPLIAALIDKGVKVLAKQVESHEAYEHMVAGGCDLFQGFFFCEPEKLSARRMTTHQAVYVNLLQSLNASSIDLNEVEDIIKHDPKLSMDMLRFLNSAAMGIRNKITSIRHGLIMLGERPLRRWGTMLAMSALTRDKPPELLMTSIIRARFCEIMAAMGGLLDRELDLFMIGLLSCLDAAMNIPMEDLVQSIPVNRDVQSVLLNEDNSPGELKRVLDLTYACEQGNWSRVIELIQSMALMQPQVAMAYYEAISWADNILRGDHLAKN
jgi:c-di-GMP-related signal transduction protein